MWIIILFHLNMTVEIEPNSEPDWNGSVDFRLGSDSKLARSDIGVVRSYFPANAAWGIIGVLVYNSSSASDLPLDASVTVNIIYQ
jgi:hypothetical protein